MAASIHSSGSVLPVSNPRGSVHRVPRTDPSGSGRQALAKPAGLADPEQLRRYQAQAEERVEVLHPLRSLDEMPRRSQEALAAYRGTISAAQAYEGGELVGLDIYV